MKVLVIGFGKIYIMSYVHFYLKQLSEQHCDIHLIYWDRDGKMDVPVPANVTAHKFEYPIGTDIPRWRKLPAFWNYRKMCKTIIESENFDLAIVLTTPPGVILFDVLRKFFFKKYIFDFRDITSENIWLFRKLVNRLIKSSAATFVSSDAFRLYLSGDNIRTSHNILLDSLYHRDVRRCNSRDQNPIRIRYWGLIRHEKINRSIIDKLSNDARFELHYHGREDEEAINLKQYCSDTGARNIFFHGIYKPEERYIFAADTDIMHNFFDNDKTMQPAMANKFYDGITLYIPQLCNSGSFMGKQVTDSKIGLECSPYSESFADDVFNFYKTISWEEFEKQCDDKLSEIMAEYDRGINVIGEFLRKKEF